MNEDRVVTSKSLLQRFWWILVIVGLLVVTFVSYIVYQNHRHGVYESYLLSAQGAYNQRSYPTAISDYQDALKYYNTPSVQQDLANAKMMKTQYRDFENGVQNLQGNANLSAALKYFDLVTPQDKLDYSKAQGYIKKIQLSLVVNKLQNDASAAMNDISVLNTPTNKIADLENAMTGTVALGTQAFANDLARLNEYMSVLNADSQQIVSDGDVFSADMQSLNNKTILTIAKQFQSDLTLLENDASDMYTVAYSNYATLQSQNANNYYGGYATLSTSNTDEWNADIQDLDNQSNALSNLQSELNAYHGSQANTGSGSSL